MPTRQNRKALARQIAAREGIPYTAALRQLLSTTLVIGNPGRGYVVPPGRLAPSELAGRRLQDAFGSVVDVEDDGGQDLRDLLGRLHSPSGPVVELEAFPPEALADFLGLGRRLEVIEQQLDRLRALPAGWGEDGAGQVVSTAALDAARELLHRVVGRGCEAEAGVFPRPDGGALLEWVEPGRVVSVEVSPRGGFSVFEADVPSEESVDEEVSVAGVIRGCLGVGAREG